MAFTYILLHTTAFAEKFVTASNSRKVKSRFPMSLCKLTLAWKHLLLQLLTLKPT